MSLTIRTDVTAVKFYRNFILTGIGSFVNIFKKSTAKLMQRVHCLNGQKIHGFVISINGEKIFVFGGKKFTVLSVEGSEVSAIRIFEPVLCDDWIHSAIWTDDDSIALLTAHNVVQKWDTTNQTMVSIHKSTDNSILYSGLLLPLRDDLIVFAGTVFSEVIIHKCGEDTALHHLKGHRGVIFSITCDPQKEIIVTTSDDRSVRIWAMNNPAKCTLNTIEYWTKIKIECAHEIYGHTARVMRSLILKEFIVSAGEDGAICFWNLNGKFVRKVVCHQTSTVWALDGDNYHIVTGGGDSGIILHPVTIATDYIEKDVINLEVTPKKLQFTARNKVVMVTESDELIYYDLESKIEMAYKLLHESTYKMLSLSSCKQLVAVADMCGNLNVFAESCKDTAYLQMVIETKTSVDNLMSLHWAGNRHLVLCTSQGQITVLASMGNKTEVYAKFALPSCKEKYLTAAAIHPDNNMIIVGDRCGNVHCFVKRQASPVKTFKKSQGSYGPTSITVKDNVIITTGRTGTIAYHSLKDSKYLTEKHLEFQWVEKFLDKNESLVCGFQEKKFVVSNVKMNAKILEVPCGGGHRPWDAARYFEKVDGEIEEFIRLVYFKNKTLYLITSQLSKIVSKTIVEGSQSKIIHCMQTYKTEYDRSITYVITGGEDTTLRVSSMNSDYEFHDKLVYKHLSNIRSLKTYPMKDNKLIAISAGGRAQICINLLKFDDKLEIDVSCEELVNHMLLGDDGQRRRHKTWRDKEFDINPETRMMDIDAIRFDENRFLIFVGCSDAVLRTFVFDNSLEDGKFKPLEEVKHHKTCILKTIYFRFGDKDIVITATTRGEIAFWNLHNKNNEFGLTPFENGLNIDNSGTNSLDYKILSGKLLIATGGDDNSISLNLVNIENSDIDKRKLSIRIIDQRKYSQFHCSQISGLVLLDNVMVTSSIDQRVTVFKWDITEDTIECEFVNQVLTDVADIAGLNLLEHTSEFAIVCVYGKGFEVLKLDLKMSE